MANPQIENGYIKIANEIWDEIIRRNFSKRQKDILNLVWRLSYGCRRKKALIPLQKDFTICGVPQQHVKNELKYLESCKVLLWDQEKSEYEINKNYELWQVSPVTSWDSDRFHELIHLNISKQKQPKKIEEKPKPKVRLVRLKTSQNRKFFKARKNTDFTKHEVGTSQNMKSNFTKHEVLDDSNPCGSKVGGVSKNKKDSIKDISSSSTTTETENYETIHEVYVKAFGALMMNGLFSDYIRKLKERKCSEGFIKEAMKEAGSSPKPNLKYFKSICERWIKEGINTREENKVRKKANVIPYKKQNGGDGNDGGNTSNSTGGVSDSVLDKLMG
ncbi:replication protein [Chengkuizengella axinellae]|uniref:Replication protein n=1 Tax=Chengkuizengella axinellae TaxID=3064388 RepID=A0ABT9J8A9_9BACL|nr:replication protein [Chengkuizengella sp. 2205SS18-9]MDP5277230.1 replication protein [Chengkuizengella sp. 2205SS18-9]